MEEEQISRQLVKWIALKRMVKYVQAIELISFMLAGLFLGISFYDKTVIMAAPLFFVAGIFLAVLAGESAIEEYKLYGDKK